MTTTIYPFHSLIKPSGGSSSELHVFGPLWDGDSSGETAGVSPVSVSVSVPAVTATFRVSAVVAAVAVSVSVPSLAATYRATAAVSPVSVSVTVPAVTASQSSSADVSPVNVAVSVPAVTATFRQDAGVSPVPIAISVPAVNATFQAAAGVSPVAISISVPSVTASQGGTASVSPVVVSVTVPAVTATFHSAAAAIPVAVTIATPAVSAAFHATAAAPPASVTISVPAVTAVQGGSAGVSPVAIAIAVPSVSPTFHVSAALVAVNVAISVPSVTASATLEAKRIRNRRVLFTNAPFSTAGTSVYSALESGGIVYRNLRSLGKSKRLLRRASRSRGRWIKGTGGNHDISASVTKTNRIGFVADPGASIDVNLSGFTPVSGTAKVVVDVRTCADDVENLTTGYGLATVEIDTSGNTVSSILGTAHLLSTEQLAGGICKVRILWLASPDGVQPNQFTLSRTAGPSLPADVVVSYSTGLYVEFLTSSLLDSSAYTFKIEAANGATTKDVLTGISVTADATGPAAPTGVVAEGI